MALVQQLTSSDRVRVEDHMLALQDAFRLTQARVDLLKLLCSGLGGSVTDSEVQSLSARSGSPGVMAVSCLTERSIALDLFLPLLWSTVSSQNGVAATASLFGTASQVPASSAHVRVHLLYPSASIVQLNEKAHRAAGHGSTASDTEDQATLAMFLRILASWLDTTLAALEDPDSAAAAVAQSQLLRNRLHLVLHFIGQEYSTMRDKLTLLQSGVLTSLVRFAFHEKAVAQLHELTRIAWAAFSLLIAHVLAPTNDAVISASSTQASVAALLRTNSSAAAAVDPQLALSTHPSLLTALRPLQDAILHHLQAILDIPVFNSVQLLPAPELLSQAQRVAPQPLDLVKVCVGTVLDAQDRANSWFCAVVKKMEQRIGGMQCWVAFSGWPSVTSDTDA